MRVCSHCGIVLAVLTQVDEVVRPKARRQGLADIAFRQFDLIRNSTVWRLSGHNQPLEIQL